MSSRIPNSILSGGFSLAALSFVFSAASAARADGPYHFLKDIPIATDGGWDYLSIDAGAHRLYVAHATEVVVIDTTTDQVVGTIADTPGVHGVAFAPKLGRGFVSDGKANKVSIVDLATLKTTGQVAAGTNPDCILFEAGQNEVYAFNGRSQSATVFAADTGQVTATIPLGGKPEFGQADPASGLVYDNLEDKSEVIAIDTKTHSVVSHWPIAPGEGPSALALDSAHHRLFVGCDHLMVILDSAKGTVVATEPVGDGVDAAAFDPGTGYAFVSAGGDSGSVTVVHEDSPNQFTVVQTLATEPRARTMQVDPISHKIYLASGKFEAPAAPSAAEPRPRPRMIPGSFKILVYGLAP
jgi:DNA-binding beta-propeller fold protein YncE